MTDEITKAIEKLSEEFGIDKKRSIGEVAEDLGIETHVIRFWEENFEQIKPEIGKGGRRYYYNKQFKILEKIKKLLHEEGYTIAGAQKFLKKRKHTSVDYNEEMEDAELAADHNSESAKNVDFLEMEDNYLKESNIPSRNIVANSAQVTNINNNSNSSLNKEQREEVFALFKNITKNLGDLKMLLRS